MDHNEGSQDEGIIFQTDTSKEEPRPRQISASFITQVHSGQMEEHAITAIGDY